MNDDRRREIRLVLYEIDKIRFQLKNILGDEIEAYYNRHQNLHHSDEGQWSQTSYIILRDVIEKLESSEEELRKLI